MKELNANFIYIFNIFIYVFNNLDVQVKDMQMKEAGICQGAAVPKGTLKKSQVQKTQSLSPEPHSENCEDNNLMTSRL